MKPENLTMFNLSLCGIPPYCDYEAIRECWNTTIRDCSLCSNAGSDAILTYILLMATFIILGNSLVVASVLVIESKSRKTQDLVKTSLAIADMFTGLHLFAVCVPYIVLTPKLTFKELNDYVIVLRQSDLAKAMAPVLMFTYISSLYHLFYMSVQRFIAIYAPFTYRNQSSRSVSKHLAILWVILIVGSTFSLWESNYFQNFYRPEMFQFMTTVDPVAMGICIVLPYLVMSGLTFATACNARKRLQRSRSHRVDSAANRETSLLKVTFCMYLGFTVTVVPVVITNALQIGQYLTCDTVSVAIFATVHTSTLSGILNVLIYSAFDRTFRQTILKVSYRIRGKTERNSCRNSNNVRLRQFYARNHGQSTVKRAKSNDDVIKQGDVMNDVSKS